MPLTDIAIDECVKSDVDQCSRGKCQSRALEDSDYCAKHRDEVRQYQRTYMATLRENWDAAEWCTRCGDPHRAKDSKWCAACLVATGKVHRKDVKSRVDQHGDRIAARLIPWENSPTNANRVRLRGGKKGARPKSADDASDSRDARKCLDAMDEGLQYADSPEVKDLPRIQRQDVRARALNHGYRAIGFLFTIMKRHDQSLAEVLQMVQERLSDDD